MEPLEKRGPSAQDATLALARRAADEGDYPRVSELFAAAARRGIAAVHAGAWRRLLVEAGDFAAAAELSVEDALTASAAREEETGGDEVLDFEPGHRQANEAPLVDPGLLRLFLRWFVGRGDVYARQWFDSRRDRGGYWPVRELLDARIAVQHLRGRVTLGQYVLFPDSTVSFAALDLDPTPEALAQVHLSAGGQPAIYEPLLAYATRIVEACANLDLPAFPEDTGGVGVHVWLFFEPRIAAERARGLLREILWRAGAQPPGVAVEIFPKQDRLSGKGLGNLVKLPLGVHQATLRQSRFLGPDGSPVDDGDGLRRLCSCPPSAVEAVLARRVVSLPTRSPGDAPRRGEPPLRLPSGPSPRALAEALAAVPAGEAKAAADGILAGCAVLRELARRAHEGPSLEAEAARMLLYSIGLVGRENERIEQLFAAAGVSRKEIDRVRSGLQSPVGCRRLRERFPQLCSGCVCPEPPDGGYSTPALFAFRRPPVSKARAPWPLELDASAPWSDAGLPEIERRLARIEAAIDRLLDEKEPEP